MISVGDDIDIIMNERFSAILFYLLNGPLL